MNVPRWLEAYPAITSTAALRNWSRGRGSCVWRSENRGIVGAAHVDWISTSLMSIRYAWAGRPYLSARSGDETLEVIHARAGTRSSRAMFLCPGCSGRAIKLSLVGEGFRCQRCHRKRNLSAIISPLERASEKYYEIERVIRHGRPPRMPNKSYHELLAEKRELLRLFPEISSAVPKTFAIVSDPEWLSKECTIETSYEPLQPTGRAMEVL